MAKKIIFNKMEHFVYAALEILNESKSNMKKGELMDAMDKPSKMRILSDALKKDDRKGVAVWRGRFGPTAQNYVYAGYLIKGGAAGWSFTDKGEEAFAGDKEDFISDGRKARNEEGKKRRKAKVRKEGKKPKSKKARK